MAKPGRRDLDQNLALTRPVENELGDRQGLGDCIGPRQTHCVENGGTNFQDRHDSSVTGRLRSTWPLSALYQFNLHALSVSGIDGMGLLGHDTTLDYVEPVDEVA
jgi:hypothetical protein